MHCLICKSKLIFGKEFDAKEYGYDTGGVVKTYACINENCGLFYEKINLLPPQNGFSEDYDKYGKEYVKFYNLEDIR